MGNSHYFFNNIYTQGISRDFSEYNNVQDVINVILIKNKNYYIIML